MTVALRIAGFDARVAFGFVVSRVQGLHDGPAATLTLQPVPGRPGALLMQEPQIGVREFVVSGVVRGATAAAARAFRDRMLAVLARAEVTLVTGDDVSREITAVVTSVSAEPIGAQFIARDIRMSFQATALEPYWRATAPTTVAGITTTPVACLLGSAPVAPVLTVTGGGSVVTVTLRNALGVVVTQLQLAGLITGVPLVIDCAAQTIRQNEQNMLGALLAGEFPILDPRDGDPVAGAFPTLSVSQGVMTAVYQRRWA
jgi:hypothetical protein